MRISDWSSDVCSSDPAPALSRGARCGGAGTCRHLLAGDLRGRGDRLRRKGAGLAGAVGQAGAGTGARPAGAVLRDGVSDDDGWKRSERRRSAYALSPSGERYEGVRSEEPTSELKSPMRISY